MSLVQDRRLLTSREKEILALIAEGRSNAEIATALDISLHTVKRHIESILLKLDTANRTSAAALWGAHPGS